METESANRLPIAKTVKETVEFPEKDESVGEVVISFSGPHPMEFLERKVWTLLISLRMRRKVWSWVNDDCRLWMSLGHTSLLLLLHHSIKNMWRQIRRFGMLEQFC